MVDKDETLKAIIAGAKANGSWDKKYPDDDKKVQPAQPAQEWSWVCNECGAKEFTSIVSEADLQYLACAGCGCDEFHKEEQPAQEPVAYCYVQKGTSVDILTFDAEPDDAVTGTLFPLYTTPPQRPWVGLTGEEMQDCIKTADYNQGQYKRTAYWAHLATAIEAALRSKNI